MSNPDSETQQDQLTDREFEALLLEYDKLKDESTQRIQARDNFVYLNVASIGLLISFAGTDPKKAIAYLAIPWISIGFGWTYLMNDEKISALARYTRYHLRPRLGSTVLNWETTKKRRTSLSGWHKWGQFLVDLLMFVVPTPVAIAAYGAIAKSEDRWVIGALSLVVTEALFALALFLMMLAHSPLTKRWDVAESAWETSGNKH